EDRSTYYEYVGIYNGKCVGSSGSTTEPLRCKIVKDTTCTDKQYCYHSDPKCVDFPTMDYEGAGYFWESKPLFFKTILAILLIAIILIAVIYFKLKGKKKRK
ncbi:MAG: hypothetical protein AABY22_02390, partial [Nanoarchaeota archaeon]